MSRHRLPERSARRALQRGAVLVIALILLALVTVHALATYTSGATQLRITGSMQARHEARVAAAAAIGAALSSESFLDDPAGFAARPLAIDVDGDGVPDYQVRLAATCEDARAVPAAALDPANADDAACATGAAFGAASLCADTQWNLRAVAVTAPGAAATGAAVEVNQGVRVRADAAQARTAC